LHDVVVGLHAFAEEALGFGADGAVETNEWFVACFSSERDDLSQWRAYGGGESGYSIGFASTELIKRGLLDHRLLVPVNYDRATHLLLVKAVTAATVQFFLDGLSAGRERGAWAQAFLMEWVNNITYLAPILKDPAFHAEKEWRLILRLRPEDIENMKYRQKPAMMSRHLPLAFPPPGQPASKLLPISEIMVGPSRHKEISRVTVANMLRTHAYPDDQRTVSVSSIPFQTTYKPTPVHKEADRGPRMGDR
jgi:hypothetical protein